MGNPDFSGDPDWDFPELPGAEKEARELAKTFAAEPLIGKLATASEIKKRLEQSDYVFLATHAVADARRPLDGSFIALTESRLTAREIQHMRLKASLAVLSACQTGLGQTHDAGIIGMARAFQLAGVPGVVMSLWNVDDDATYDLMSEFARSLRKLPPQEALRRAMLETRKVHQAPAKWASFVYFGEPMGFSLK